MTVAETNTAQVIEVKHPLVQHKLSYLRDKDTPTVHFRKLVNEVTLLLTYEATKDLRTEDVDVETPLEHGMFRGSVARRSPCARSCAPGSGCSTACSR